MSSSYREEMSKLQESGRLRQLRPLSGRRGCRVQYQGRECLNLTSNDYLGIGGDSQLLGQFYGGMDAENMLDRYGLGACSSRLLTGDTEPAHELEEALATAYGGAGQRAALLFNSGYHANIGILAALLGKNDLILSDKLNHASIHDGLQLCRAAHKRFAHRDYDQLEHLLITHRHHHERVVIVSESVFSMDGDVADLGRLVQLKKKFDTLLYLDEAHAVGLYGAMGLGKAEEQGLMADIDLLVGTFGKAFASIGAFVICHQDIREYLVNRSRSLIFTTALPPILLNWNQFVFRRQQSMNEKREHLAALAQKMRLALQDQGLATIGNSNIIPYIIGDDQETMRLAEKLQERGFLIFPVRPPAVPEGTARFRLSLTADMRWQDLCELPGILREESTLRQAGTGRTR